MADSTLAREIARRRTFAIISHPDAGKTTLTEKLLLYGGAIHLAGSVRARKNQRAATSDWMELERERGISITSTVLQFDYQDFCINLLDTPGHKDFSEDTYRVLTAVDSAIMVIDAAKGIEDRTRKLFEICSIRGVPIFTFVNKMDRPARDPLSILDEIEKVLGIGAFPVTWPLGSGDTFKGVYDRLEHQVHLFERTVGGKHKAPTSVKGPDDDQLRGQFDDDTYKTWRDEIEMLHGAGESFAADRVMAGKTTPVFFGSALTNFGVQLLLNYFVRYGAPPMPRSAANGTVAPDDESFSAFVFKVQANMNPRHRDNLSFIRVCSGRFEKDMVVPDPRTGKPIRLAYPQKLFAQGRETMETACAGDIVGLVSHDPFRIGDTLSSNPAIRYDEIPRFAPEVFSFLRNANPSKSKQFKSGLDQLLDEGVIQAFRLVDSVTNVPLLGAVGPLQFEVVLYRLQNEYGAEVRMEPAAYKEIRWFNPGTNKAAMQDAYLGAGVHLAEDVRGQLVILFPDKWNLDYFMGKNPKLELHHVSPHSVSEQAEKK